VFVKSQLNLLLKITDSLVNLY